jgi:hypothetical protein
VYQQKEIKMKSTLSVIVPAGTYYLGDPCYAVPDEMWSELLEATGFFDDTPHILFRGKYNIVAFNTMYGDGCFAGNNRFEYGVDAGMIGLVETSIGIKPSEGLNTIIKFDVPTLCTRDDNGTLTFGSVVIHTGDNEEDEDDRFDEDDSDTWDRDDIDESETE